MNVDEMDLVRQALDVTPWRPEAYERAQAVLRGVMAESGPAPEATPVPAVVPMGGRVTRARNRRGGVLGTKGKVGIGAGVAAVAAAAAAVAITVTSSPAPASAPAASAVAGNPQLAQLADKIVVSEGKLSGNASLEIRNSSASSAAPGANGIDLYTDNGTYYWGFSKSALQQAIAGHEDDDSFKGDITAALYAVNGNITTARARMAVAGFAPGIKPKAIYPPGAKPITHGQQMDNQIWTNSLAALVAAANPQVRAGVLRLVATIHGVTVTKTTVDGQPALTLARPFVSPFPTLPGTAHDVLVINASTGLPIVSMTRWAGGEASGVTYYHVFRATLASVAAGKF